MFDIKGFRKYKKFTQSGMGDILGVNQATIAKAESGGMTIPQRWIEVLYKDFEKEEVDLFQVQEPNSAYGKPTIIKHDPNGKEIPLFEGQAFATISPAMADVVTLRPDTFIRIPMFSQGEYAVQVTGHSMKPYISHGDWAVIKRITNREAVIYGEPYLVITKSDNLKTVKFLKAGDSEDTFWLIPYNIEQFEPQEIDKDEVLELYRVMGVFRTV